MPPQTTGINQPLDVYGFRIWMRFVKKISDRVLLDKIDIKLFHRNNIIKLQSLVHNQLSSEKFINVFKYSWFACEYTDCRPEKFENPVEYCFKIDGKKCAYTHLSCDFCPFINCSWCEKTLCF